MSVGVTVVTVDFICMSNWYMYMDMDPPYMWFAIVSLLSQDYHDCQDDHGHTLEHSPMGFRVVTTVIPCSAVVCCRCNFLVAVVFWGRNPQFHGVM